MNGFCDVAGKLVMNIEGDDNAGLNCILLDGIFMGMNGIFVVDENLIGGSFLMN